MNIKYLWDSFIATTGFLYREKRPITPRGKDDVIIEMPHYRQNQTYTCGMVSALMCIHKYRKVSTEKALKIFKPNMKWGVSTAGMVRGMKKLEFRISTKRNMSFDQVRETLDKGWPIISLIRLHGDEYHWMVVVGYSVTGGEWIHMYGHRETTIKWSEFKKNKGGCVSLIIKGKNENHRRKK